MTHEQRHDDRADRVLRTALRAAVPEPPIDDVDWDALHARIQTRAGPLLIQRPRQLLHLLGRWSRRGSVFAASAAAALALLLAVSAVLVPDAQTALAFRTVEEELAEAMPISARTLLVAAGEQDAMLDAALFYDAEEW